MWVKMPKGKSERIQQTRRENVSVQKMIWKRID
jgi:hypothetical protein